MILFLKLEILFLYNRFTEMWKQMNLPNPVNDMCEYEANDDVISRNINLFIVKFTLIKTLY